MKTWLLLSLLFFPAAICFQGIEELRKSVKLEEDKEKILENFNNFRRMMAKKFQSANMWKLEWSDDLVQTAKSLPADCNSLEPGSNYRFSLIPPKWNEWYEEEGLYSVDEDKEYGAHTSLYWMEWVNPVQRTVGCADYKCKDRKSRIPKNPVPTMNFKSICLFGPVPTIDREEDEKRGEAGSKCEEEGGEDDDGLCVPSGSSGFSILFNISIMASLVFLVSMIFD
ncbi:hypothetical protein CAEBREN_23303 [Caenorhabditis brenneri]|uniref:Uncharacterized protein n=1 Tax=Caenorhabditis brenneri TaxID=135651 RepID=G0NTN2_CAEBE|nr:hypothetical protein CAEBREN_23303 [Caenorhabditis brenneri]